MIMWLENDHIQSEFHGTRIEQSLFAVYLSFVAFTGHSFFAPGVETDVESSVADAYSPAAAVNCRVPRCLSVTAAVHQVVVLAPLRPLPCRDALCEALHDRNRIQHVLRHCTVRCAGASAAHPPVDVIHPPSVAENCGAAVSGNDELPLCHRPLATRIAPSATIALRIVSCPTSSSGLLMSLCIAH